MYQTSLVADVFKCLRDTVASPYSLSFCQASPMPDPAEYCDHNAFARDYAVYTYVRKLKGSDSEKTALERAAILGFKETEAHVASTNRRLKGELSGYPGAERLISDVRSEIARILGRLDLDAFARGCDWGPGATSSLKTIDARVDKKILEPQLSVTHSALPYAVAYLKYDSGWLAARAGCECVGPYSPLLSNFKLVQSSRLTTVDKTIKERRVIDIQPTFNLFLQKGVGFLIRRRLQRDGIDLDSQTRNQILAQFALRLNLATIDLSKASDTISYQLVELLLPSDWFAIMRDLRTSSTILPDGTHHYLSKFSAMGNGYTFELESLIFHALCIVVKRYSGVADTLHGVYGDDLIVDRRSVKTLYDSFRLFGFIANQDKSWSTTLFRESCGKHFFNGFDVTPLYQKCEVDSPLELVKAANRLLRWNHRINGGVLDAELMLPYLCLRDTFGYWVKTRSPNVKSSGKIRKFCPLQPFEAEGDDGLIDPFCRPVLHGGMMMVDKFHVSPTKEKSDDYALYALTLRRMSKRRCVDMDLLHRKTMSRTSPSSTDLADLVLESAPFLGFTTVRGGKKVIGYRRGQLYNVQLRFPDII